MLATGEVVVTLLVRGLKGQARVEAMVDTGFNEQLTLPMWVVERLGLEYQTQAIYRLADGAKSESRVFSAEIEWHGAWQNVAVIEMENDPLLGIGAMKGCSLYIEVADQGRVEIQPLETGDKN
ncbi:MAG TPA: aspartyl protease family protein [Phycisphaerae bacterium]|nr:aspartyl protease family protein [Phycisphaerae bacterium]